MSEKVLNWIQSIDTFKQDKTLYSNLTKNGKDHFDNIIFPSAAARTKYLVGHGYSLKPMSWLSTLAVYLANKRSWLKHFCIYLLRKWSNMYTGLSDLIYQVVSSSLGAIDIKKDHI